jgi:hypothetical protein
MVAHAVTKWRLVATPERGRLFFETSSCSSHLFAHDLFRKPDAIPDRVRGRLFGIML